MKLALTRAEEAAILRRRAAKGRQRLNGPKLAATNTGKQDRGRVLDKPFLAYLRRQPCEACGSTVRVEAAHIRYSDASKGAVNPGMQRRNHDRHANPLCHDCHQHDQHKRRERDFWAGLGKDAYDTAAEHFAAFVAGRDQTRNLA